MGFTAEDWAENIWWIGEVSKLINKSHQICIVAFISPYRADRDWAWEIHDKDGLKFIECHVATPLEECEARDIKGLYKKAREGIIKQFTGISDPYEEPLNPELVVNSKGESINQSVEQILNHLWSHNVIPSNDPISLFDFSENALKEASSYEKIVLFRHELENL